MAKPTTSSNKAGNKPAKAAFKSVHGHAVPAKASPNSPGLHYSREDLHADYTQTYGVFMKMLAIGIGGALVYFFAMIIYLGAIGHTPGDDYVREFGSRIQYDYKGLRLPQYDDPSILDAAKPAQSH